MFGSVSEKLSDKGLVEFMGKRRGAKLVLENINTIWNNDYSKSFMPERRRKQNEVHPTKTDPPARERGGK